MASKKKQRADELLVATQKAVNISAAQRLIYAGKVSGRSHRIVNPSEMIANEETLIIAEPSRFVSRAALKLLQLKEDLKLSFSGKTAIDVGSSTGGFSDLMLQDGASRIYAVDTGTNQLHYSIRSNPKVIVMENTSFRDLQFNKEIEEKVDVITCDISFTSSREIFLFANIFLKENADLIVLIKPQFEASRQQANVGHGLVSDNAVHEEIINNIKSFALLNGYHNIYLKPTEIKGKIKKNIEYISLWRKQLSHSV